jgi:hypothetical protein
MNEKRLHYMAFSEVLRIGKKMSEELPYLIQPSSSDIALAHLYAYYEIHNNVWYKRMFRSIKGLI